MVHKTDGELGRITTSFEVQCISHGKVPARAICKSSVGRVVLKKNGHDTTHNNVARCCQMYSVALVRWCLSALLRIPIRPS